MPPKTENTIQLRDGRRLGFAEYGDPNGKPLIYFHGLPGSRLDAFWTDEPAARLGARVISVDRPGIGFSDFQPGRTLLDWPEVVRELAAALGLNRYGVMGVSGGSPYAAVCAYRIPECLTAAGIVVGIGPLDIPHALEGRMQTERTLIFFLRHAPWPTRLIFFNLMAVIAHTSPGRITDIIFGSACEIDRAWLAEPGHRLSYTHDLCEAFRQGGRGYYWDSILLYTRPWGFPLEKINIPVYLWYGEPDKNVPVATGRYLAEKIPACRAVFYENEGHITLPNRHAGEILSALLEHDMLPSS